MVFLRKYWKYQMATHLDQNCFFVFVFFNSLVIVYFPHIAISNHKRRYKEQWNSCSRRWSIWFFDTRKLVWWAYNGIFQNWKYCLFIFKFKEFWILPFSMWRWGHTRKWSKVKDRVLYRLVDWRKHHLQHLWTAMTFYFYFSVHLILYKNYTLVLRTSYEVRSFLFFDRVLISSTFFFFTKKISFYFNYDTSCRVWIL